jgi:hypothetical protein
MPACYCAWPRAEAVGQMLIFFTFAINTREDREGSGMGESSRRVTAYPEITM